MPHDPDPPHAQLLSIDARGAAGTHADAGRADAIDGPTSRIAVSDTTAIKIPNLAPAIFGMPGIVDRGA
jgi:hypothetical protein